MTADRPDPAPAADPAAEAPTPVDLTDENAPVDDTTEHDAGNAEAAKWRKRLREVKATRAALAAKLEAMQRAAVEQLAAGKMSKPADFWLVHPQLAALLDDQGDIDPEKITTAVEAVVADRASWRVQRAASFDGGARVTPPAPASWADVLSNSQR